MQLIKYRARYSERDKQHMFYAEYGEGETRIWQVTYSSFCSKDMALAYLHIIILRPAYGEHHSYGYEKGSRNRSFRRLFANIRSAAP